MVGKVLHERHEPSGEKTGRGGEGKQDEKSPSCGDHLRVIKPYSAQNRCSKSRKTNDTGPPAEIFPAFLGLKIIAGQTPPDGSDEVSHRPKQSNQEDEQADASWKRQKGQKRCENEKGGLQGGRSNEKPEAAS